MVATQPVTDAEVDTACSWTLDQVGQTQDHMVALFYWRLTDPDRLFLRTRAIDIHGDLRESCEP
jgi:hypothetical protein